MSTETWSFDTSALLCAVTLLTYYLSHLSAPEVEQSAWDTCVQLSQPMAQCTGTGHSITE